MKMSASRFQFAFEGSRVVNEKDIIMGYEVFLGRVPESSLVIMMKMNKSPDVVLDEFLNCPEFEAVVLDRLGTNRPLPPKLFDGAPSTKQLGWLKSLINFEPHDWDELETCDSWEQFFRRFLRLGAVNRLKTISSELEKLTKDLDVVITATIDDLFDGTRKIATIKLTSPIPATSDSTRETQKLRVISNDIMQIASKLLPYKQN